MKCKQIWIEEAKSFEGLQVGLNMFLDNVASENVISIDLTVYHCESTDEQIFAGCITYLEELCASEN